MTDSRPGDNQPNDDAGVPGPGVDAPLFAIDLNPDLVAFLEEVLAHPPVLLGLDFDGVLAPLVEDPETSRILPVSIEAIASLSRRAGVQVVLVSGRDATQLVTLAEVPDGTRVVGSHGLQHGVLRLDEGTPWLDARPPDLSDEQVALHREVRRQTEQLATEADGAWVEIKPAAVVLHTRTVADRSHADALEAKAAAGPGAMPGVKTMEGKNVVEMSVTTSSKGEAVTELRDELGAATVIYLGDDRTDEDVFTILGGTDMGIKVGEGPTGADWRVATPDEVSALLWQIDELLASGPAT